MNELERRLPELQKGAAEFIALALRELSPSGRRERRRRRMKPYNQLKEVQDRKKKHGQRKLSPKYCSIKIRVNEEQYKKIQEESLAENISMAEYARRKIYA